MRTLMLVVAFILMMQMEMVWSQVNTPSPSDSAPPGGIIAVIKKTSAWCGASTNVESRYGAPEKETGRMQQDITGPQASDASVVVAEDMHCRQCHGKCAADNLRCRSQCLEDSTCLAHCEERSSKCTTMCKQVFQCQ